MFSSYPDEWPGTGLLLLRAAIGGVLLSRGISFLLGWHDLKFAGAVIALLALTGATLLLTGYLTRIGAALVALAITCGISFWSSVPTIDFFQSRLTAGLLGVIAIALVCLGPGAFSLDARLFGRQEIIFPKNRPEE
jgi:uncharacterized membrane protein YphA (DoxX/SURF4 family)